MASTPPPLPSSSEDSDFDDDDFGCFSSAPPVTTHTNPVKNAEQSFTGSQEQSGQSSKIDGSDSCPESEKDKRSECLARVNSEEDVNSKDNTLSSDHDSQISFQTENNLHVSSSSSQCNTENVSDKVEEESNVSTSGFSQFAENSSEFPKDATNNESNELEQCSVQDIHHPSHISKEMEYNSKVEEGKENSGAQSEEEGDFVTNRDQNENDQVESKSVENDSCQSTALHTTNMIAKEDKFAEWDDMQSFDSPVNAKDDELCDNDTADQNSEDGKRLCIDNLDELNGEENTISIPSHISGNIPLETVETSTTDHADIGSDFGAFDDVNKDAMFNSGCNDSSELEVSSQGKISDHISPTDQDEEDSKKDSIPPDDFIDKDDDDDFGDFADFASNQGFENNDKEVEPPPISFRTSTADSDEENSVSNEINDSSSLTAATTGLKLDTDVSNAGEEVNCDNAGDAFDDDDWGFKSADTAGETDCFKDESTGDNNGDDWAAFSESPNVAVASKDDDDGDGKDEDDFDDFDDFSSSTSPTAPTEQTDSSMFKAEVGSSKVEKVFFICFPSISTATTHSVDNDHTSDIDEENSEVDALCSLIEMGLKVTPHAKEETWTIAKELRNKDPVVGTWGRLKDVNSSHALTYGWNTSHCCQEVYSTLHIDTKNVLFSQKKQAVPFYASGLSILEPIRGGPNPVEKNQPPLQPTLLDTEKHEEDSKKVLDIPPVDFDWGSSGLTNPLKVFKADNFNNGLSSLDSFTDVLQKNMEPTKELSPEAKSILSKMPNLNFMRSNVLMFPIKD